MKLTSVSITIRTSVGLNEARKKALAQKLATRYPMAGDIGPAGFFAIFKALPTERIVFGQDDFSIAAEGEDVSPDFEQMRKDIDTVYETLILDTPQSGTFRIMGIEDVTSDLMSYSLEHFVTPAVGALAKKLNMGGVGLRFISPRDPHWWELKVEPMIASPGKAFIEMNSHFPSMDLNAMLDNMESTFKEFGHNYVGGLVEAGLIPRKG